VGRSCRSCSRTADGAEVGSDEGGKASQVGKSEVGKAYKQNIIKPLLRPGHSAWAARQSAMWSSMATETESKFEALLESNPPPEVAQVVWPH
jgi:hypothetical protein